MSQWILYMLECRDGSLYTGITLDLSRRLQQHLDGTGSRFTRARRPVRVVYREPQPSHGDALRRERAVKRLSRAQKLHMIRTAPSESRG